MSGTMLVIQRIIRRAILHQNDLPDRIQMDGRLHRLGYVWGGIIDGDDDRNYSFFLFNQGWDRNFEFL